MVRPNVFLQLYIQFCKNWRFPLQKRSMEVMYCTMIPTGFIRVWGLNELLRAMSEANLTVFDINEWVFTQSIWCQKTEKRRKTERKEGSIFHTKEMTHSSMILLETLAVNTGMYTIQMHAHSQLLLIAATTVPWIPLWTLAKCYPIVPLQCILYSKCLSLLYKL